MLIGGIGRRVSRNRVTEMICRLNHHHLFLSDSNPGNPYSVFIPNSIALPLKVRCFHVTRHALNLNVSHSESISSRGSRTARTEAQVALFDYLHSTRGLSFTDAEHISKNSPYFLQGLLSNTEIKQDVSHSMAKFFRYNPINEFEPFLESLGLTPPELNSLLPRTVFFLTDDQIMFDNYHVLCNYGIPRGKIGKVYKEASVVFRYDDGVLASKLRALEALGLSKSTIIKLVSGCPDLLVDTANKEFVGVVEKLKGLGFGSDWIGRYFSGKSSYNWNRMMETMRFLGEVGYSEKQMGVLFKTAPTLLFEGSGKRVYVLVGSLLKLGIKMDDIYHLLLQNPQILSVKCSENLWKAVSFLVNIGMDNRDIASIVASNIGLLSSHTLRSSRTVLKTCRDKDSLCQMIVEDPMKLLTLASKSEISSKVLSSLQNPSTFPQKATFLVGLGYVENSDEMNKALKSFRGRGDELQERFDCLVQAGLDFNVVGNMVRLAPPVLNQSKEMLEKKIDCLRNRLGYPLEAIVGFPTYLCYDMDRINLRFSMYAWLRERGAAKTTLSLSTILACSDSRFEKYFVDVDPEGPAMWESLKKLFASN